MSDYRYRRVSDIGLIFSRRTHAHDQRAFRAGCPKRRNSADRPLEFAQGLQMAMRRGRVDAAFRSVALRDLAAFPVVLDSETSAAAWTTLPSIADSSRADDLRHAAYLELALRKGAALASIDKKLRAAGAASGLELLGI